MNVAVFLPGWIGDAVMAELKAIDPVAYVRFASVYREFKDVNDFAAELTQVTPKGNHGAQPRP